jgi:hypothetical protein
VNRQHLQAFIWLRWRILKNQLKRGGIANALILAFLVVLCGMVALLLLIGFFLLGLFAFGELAPPIHMFIWDGLVAAFLLFWGIGLLTDLQRSESMALEKFLHLPVSLTGVFLINYLSSLVNVTIILFVPTALGLSLGLAISRGPSMLLLLPLVAAFLLMITALTYQFQGWLASLMVNKRRRRTIIVVTTMVFILFFQIPNLINIFQPWRKLAPQDHANVWAEKKKDLETSFANHEISLEQYQRRQTDLVHEQIGDKEAAEREILLYIAHIARIVNLVLPPGWLPLGALVCAEGEAPYALLAMLGMTALGSASLWRSYRTTLRLYTADYTSGKKQAAPVAPPPKPEKLPPNPLERELPWVPEQAAVIALAGFRSLLRAPEAKMLLLTPILMVIIFGSIFLGQSFDPPAALRPLVAFGGLSMVLISLMQIVGNQFGFDRNGFRVFVLSSVPRREILLGKNLAIAPVVLTMDLLVVAILQVIIPMRLDYLLGVLLQLVMMFLLFCLMANALSILAAVRVTPGAMKPSQPKGLALLLHFAFLFAYPLILAPTLAPWAIQASLEALDHDPGFPLGLIVAMIECLGIIFLYRLLLTWQGDLLQSREKKILDIVSSKAE